MEIKPTYVTFEQAKWLKDKEWNHLQSSVYTDKGEVIFGLKKASNGRWIHTNGVSLEDWLKRDYVEANTTEVFYRPEQWMAIEWLRVNHDIWVDIYPEMSEEDKTNWAYTIYKLNWGDDKEVHFENRMGYFTSPQEAYSAAFDYIKNNNLI